jgi:hypothetical protein
MLRKVKITGVPKARTGYQVRGSLANDVPAMGGADYNAYIGQPNFKVNKTLTAVPREAANLEAEGGETVMGNIDGSNIPSFYNIKGPRHSSGGVPLNLPDDSFIFSDTKAMKINDPALLKMFNMAVKKGGYTPAEMSKKFDINRYRQILQDPNSDKIARKTAEMMIKNYTMKLGALALAQESKKAFPQGVPLIAKPYMESVGIKEEDILPQKEEEQPESPMQEQMQAPDFEAQENPETMPNGEPIAQPEAMGPPQEEMSPEMMQQAPMAMYGMSLGGFNNDYAFGGNNQGGGITPYEKAKTKQGNITPTGTVNKFSERKQSLNDYLGQWKDLIPGIENMTEGQAQKAIYDWSLKNNPESIQNMWQTHGLTAKGMKNAKLKALSVDGSGKLTAEQLKDPKILAQLEDAYVDNYFGIRQLDPTKPEVTVTPTAKKKCECIDPDTNEKTVFEIESDDECMCGEDEPGTVSEDVAATPPRGPAPFWLQDTINTMGAFGNLMGVDKAMPFEASADLEAPRGVFYDPTRNLAANAEQANIQTQALAQFTGPQQLSARSASVQGQAAKNAADTMATFNNMNIPLANQLEQQQTGVRNQQNLLNQQTATRLYDKNTIAQQQYDNAKRQATADLRTAYNTALTNRSKTDALNQLYPNYQVDPATGGMVNYTPTEKTTDTSAEEQTALKYAESISHLPPKTQELLFKQKYGKFGGQFQNGGIFYSDNMYPFW